MLRFQTARVAWMRELVLERGASISPCVCGFSYAPSAAVNTAIARYLASAVTKVGNGFAVASSEGSRLLLAYYRNQCMHVFGNESLVAVALMSRTGTPKEKCLFSPEHEVLEASEFLLKILAPAFVFQDKVTFESLPHVRSFQMRSFLFPAPNSLCVVISWHAFFRVMGL